jgi:hypothetical protein
MATSEDFAHIKEKKLLSMERKYHLVGFLPIKMNAEPYGS